MAPITRRSMHSGAAKSVHRKPRTNQAQSESLNWSSAPQDDPSDSLALHDLHYVADRVGREVDTFAETLDKFNETLRGPDAYAAAHSLCVAYKDHGEDMVKKLRKQYHQQHMQATRDSYTRSTQTSRFGGGASTLTKRDDQAQADLFDLKRWEAERDTWELFRVLLEVRYQNDQNHDDDDHAISAGHRYESSDESFERFLIGDTVAKERFAVLQWLQNSAADADKDVPDTFGKSASLQSNNGWMETREKIKAAKRMQFGQGELDLQSSNGDVLVCDLDPDAPSRQKRTLEQGDAVAERDMWLWCWKMLRQGVPWAEICKWCADRHQGWRAISLGVAGGHENLARGSGPASGLLWRHMCLLAARSGAVSEPEAAVYGLLGGDTDSVQRVCKTWNDHVYAHYNSQLIEQYNAYILKHNVYRLPADFIRKNGLMPKMAQDGDDAIVLHKMFSRLAQGTVSDEAQSPIKLIQASMLQNSVVHLAEQAGAAASETLGGQGVASSPEASLVTHVDALRILAHVLLILKHIDPQGATPPAVQAIDHLLALYIDVLRSAGKRDLAPVYASNMTPERAVTSLAQVISDIEVASESIEFVKLMEIYHIDAIGVLKGQCRYLLDQVTTGDGERQSFSMLEATKEELYPGQRVRLDTLQGGLDASEEALIRSLEVFYSVEGHWAVTFEALADVCRKLLVQGRVSAVCGLVERMQYEMLSMSKSAHILGQSINVMDEDKVAIYATDQERLMEVQVLQKQSKAYFEISLLVQAIVALLDWRAIEHEFASKIPRPSSVPAKVKKAYEATNEAVEPLLAGLLETSGKSEQEKADDLAIRNMYLPEIVMAYNTVLCTAGHMISRDELLRSLDLAPVIADDSTAVNQAFVATGRVREALESFAQTSVIMLKLNETGKPRKEKKGRMGRNLAIWEING